MGNTKITSTLESRNFFVSLVSIVLLALEANNLSLGTDAGTIIDTVASADVGRIVSLVLVNFLNPIMKIVTKTASWSWDFLKSPNFWTQVATVVLVGLSLLGILFPEGAAANIVQAIFGKEFLAIAVALVINLINPLYHFIFDRKKVEGETVKL